MAEPTSGDCGVDELGTAANSPCSSLPDRDGRTCRNSEISHVLEIMSCASSFGVGGTN